MGQKHVCLTAREHCPVCAEFAALLATQQCQAVEGDRQCKHTAVTHCRRPGADGWQEAFLCAQHTVALPDRIDS